MVDSIGHATAHYTRQSHFDSERMAGSVAAWGKSSGIPVVNDKSTALHLSTPHTGATQTTPPTFSFGEFLDIINPLQHIPIVSSFYRNMTGDSISPVARIVGGAIFGGPLGGLTSIAAAAIEEHSGTDIAHAFTKNATNEKSYQIVEDQRTAGKFPT